MNASIRVWICLPIGWLASVLTACVSNHVAGVERDPSPSVEDERPSPAPEEAGLSGGGLDSGRGTVESTPPAPFPKQDLQWTEVSSLGFSAEEAAQTFSRTYAATLRYTDGSTTSLTISVEANQQPLRDQLAWGNPIAAVAVATNLDAEALFFGADVTLTTEDGVMDERSSADFAALSDSVGRLYWGADADDWNGSYEAAEYIPGPGEDEWDGWIYLDALVHDNGDTEGKVWDTGLQATEYDGGVPSSGVFATW